MGILVPIKKSEGNREVGISNDDEIDDDDEEEEETDKDSVI